MYLICAAVSHNLCYLCVIELLCCDVSVFTQSLVIPPVFPGPSNSVF